MEQRSDIDVAALKTALQTRRADLLRLAAASEESRRPVELDQARVGRLSRMDALQDQAMQLETGRRRQLQLQRIEAALGRMAESDYGYCVSCGEEIAAKRLELDPTTPVCIDCAPS